MQLQGLGIYLFVIKYETFSAGAVLQEDECDLSGIQKKVKVMVFFFTIFVFGVKKLFKVMDL